MRKRFTKRQKKENIIGYIFIAPQLVGFVLFVAFPLVFSLYLCFAQWNMIDMPEFVRLMNFKAIFQDRIFWKSIGNTFIYIAIVVPLTLFSSLSLAILTNRKLPLMKFFRAAFFLPMVTSTVAIAMVWTFIYQADGGVLNSVLAVFGITNPPNWLQDSKFARFAVSIVSIWLKVGYYYIIFDAGLKNIPKELYEAADIDGAVTINSKRYPLHIPYGFRSQGNAHLVFLSENYIWFCLSFDGHKGDMYINDNEVLKHLIKILNANERSTATWGEDISEDTIFEIISGYGEFSKRD